MAVLLLLLATTGSVVSGSSSNAITGLSKTMTDMKIDISLDYNWPNLVSSAPTSIELLGQIGLLASATRDFNLNRPANGAYQYLKHTSFKASLHQVTYSGWLAFQKAHKSMDEIAIRTDSMPYDLKQLLRVMGNKNPDDLKTFGPIYLDSVKLGIQACRSRANETSTEFKKMNHVVAELIQGATSTQNSAAIDITALRIKNQVKAMEKVDLERRKVKLEHDINATRKGVKVWEDKYIKSMDNFPSGWTQLGMSFCESMVKIVTFGMSSQAQIDNQKSHAPQQPTNKTKQSFYTCLDGSFRGAKLPQKTMTGLEAGKLRIVAKLDQLIIKAIDDIKSSQNPSDLVDDQAVYDQILTFVNAYSDAISSAGVQKATSTPFKSVLDQLKNIITEARQAVVSNKREGAYAGIKERLVPLQQQAICLCTMASELIKDPTVGQTSLPTQQDIASGSVTESHLKNAQMMLNKQEQRLSKLEERYEAQSKQAVVVDAELLKVMSSIKSLDSSISTTEKVLAVLKPALALLGKFEKEWKKLTRFFETVENRINVALGADVDRVTKIFDASLQSERMLSTAFGNILFNDIMRVIAESLVIRRIASKYTGLSRDHLMPLVELAGQLVTISKDSDERESLKTELDEKISASNDFILDLVQQEKVMFVNSIERRKKELREAFAPMIAGLDSTASNQISSSVQVGMATAAAIQEDNKEKDSLEKLTDGEFEVMAEVEEILEEDDGLDF